MAPGGAKAAASHSRAEHEFAERLLLQDCWTAALAGDRFARGGVGVVLEVVLRESGQGRGLAGHGRRGTTPRARTPRRTRTQGSPVLLPLARPPTELPGAGSGAVELAAPARMAAAEFLSSSWTRDGTISGGRHWRYQQETAPTTEGILSHGEQVSLDCLRLLEFLLLLWWNLLRPHI